MKKFNSKNLHYRGSKSKFLTTSKCKFFILAKGVDQLADSPYILGQKRDAAMYEKCYLYQLCISFK